MYSFDFDTKANAVKAYLSGIGSTTLNHTYGIKSSATILGWVAKYKKYGSKGLVVSHTKSVYPFKYKLKVLNWMVLHHKSYPETALHFNIAFPATIFYWERKLENGDLRPMKSKYKSHKMNDDIDSLINQLKSCRKQNLELRIQCRYSNLTKDYDQIDSIHRIIKEYSQVPISRILKILDIPRSSYYYKKKASLSHRDAYNLKLAHTIYKIREISNYKFGYRTITGILRNTVHINHKRVQRIIQMYGWQCTAFSKKKRKYNSYHGQVGKIAPNVLGGNFKTKLFGRKTTTDVSECRYGNQDIHHRIYISPYMDLATDEIIAFNISNHPTVGFTLKPLIRGLNTLKKLHLPYKTIVHSDQGIQYQSHVWQDTLKNYGAIQSMSRKGRCHDNAQMESFFHLMKVGVMDKHYQTEGQLIKALKYWIWYYNNIRPKKKLGYKSPVEYRKFLIA
ncbi:IS3 family transposase [Acetilactobacillus jinshanensis]|uniref:IS3 family transposase n=1 Tax=Acetilactobacillus jinshanensis TaxID=1720083 RepID=A0A4P6ZJ58_9LACO|nr:IS3 family transposase [Acetilactobacillus jinshanensis]URL61116.1 IS3 family transposase [uncultured bacterium]QBP17638.1 IS3 family transposase [Acetilactobacillus jinshanensis]QBP17673.1 IS3 family transposase [Acetilactobacillus jinshanensis]QBP18246.1 IS3 family transposase [Acetilactobacillus jinshanensis]QBP18260.1 IS3 family transposase [Acetilactobacillus jinshanensis]